MPICDTNIINIDKFVVHIEFKSSTETDQDQYFID